MVEQVKGVVTFVAVGFELTGVAVIVGGFVWAVVRSVATVGKTGSAGAYGVIRTIFGRSILLGLELLVAADLVRTVTIAPTTENLVSLGLLVVIRTFLSWSFDVELEGVWPWRKRELELDERTSR